MRLCFSICSYDLNEFTTPPVPFGFKSPTVALLESPALLPVVSASCCVKTIKLYLLRSFLLGTPVILGLALFFAACPLAVAVLAWSGWLY